MRDLIKTLLIAILILLAVWYFDRPWKKPAAKPNPVKAAQVTTKVTKPVAPSFNGRMGGKDDYQLCGAGPACIAQIPAGAVADGTDLGQFDEAQPNNLVEIQEPDWATKLRRRAESRGLAWGVVCVYGTYVGYAEIPGHGSPYIEDGGKPSWTVDAPTQEAAAISLYKALSLPPNTYPEHKTDAEKSKQCPPPIGGGPGKVERYATDYKTWRSSEQ